RLLPQDIENKEDALKKEEKALAKTQEFFDKYNKIRVNALNYKAKLESAAKFDREGNKQKAAELKEEAKALKADAEAWEKLAEKFPGHGKTGFHGWLEERGERFEATGKDRAAKRNENIRERRLGYKRLQDLSEYIKDRDSLGVDFKKFSDAE